MGQRHAKIVEFRKISTARTKMEALLTALLVITKHSLPTSLACRAQLDSPVPLAHNLPFASQTNIHMREILNVALVLLDMSVMDQI